MKKIYALTVVCLAFAAAGAAQTRYIWSGAADNSWTNAQNWLVGGSPASTSPNAATDSAVFNGGSGSPATVTLDVAVDVAALIVTNNTSVKITATAGASAQITVHSTNSSNPGLRIDGGSKLESDAEASAEMVVNFAAAGKGLVSGEWLFSGNADDAVSAYAYSQFADAAARLTFTNGSKLTVGPNGSLFPTDYDNTDLVFQGGSTYDDQSVYADVPAANYDAASTIIISGVAVNGVLFEEQNAIGNLIYNCPNQVGPTDLYLINNFNVNGDLSIQNTNSQYLSLVFNPGGGVPGNVVNVGIGGNLNMSGNSMVYLSSTNGNDNAINLSVQGNVNAGGSTFDLQGDNNLSKPTNLVIKGNLNHTAGTFTASSQAVNEGLPLFNIEFNGSTTQTISSWNGQLDNDAHQVSIRMNNALGLTLLSPVQVGRVDFSGPNKGVINTTSANLLTLLNTAGNSNQVVIQSSNTGYVNGPLARATSSTRAMEFPTGLSGTLRSLTITPADANANVFQAGLVNGTLGGGTTAPIAGLAGYYWNVSRNTGSSAAVVDMMLTGGISGPAPTDTLLPVAYNGAVWNDARGNFLLASNTTGTLTTAQQSSFTAFTIGYSSANGSLPITLMSFTGRKIQGGAELNWKISDNSTPVKFEVMRSADGASFVGLGSVPGDQHRFDYSFTDPSVVSGNNFYRLKMFDQDGTITFSNIIVVMNGSKGVIISSMMPTLVRDRSRLNVSASVKGTLQLVITDISGRIIRTQVASIDSGSQDVWLDASSLPSGMFQVTGYINGERTATFRFIKQ